MTLNCKPGDIAVVIGGSSFAGMICEVLYAAPQERFNLPDGKSHCKAPPNYWVLKFLSDIPAIVEGTMIPRMTKFGCGPDSKLRPIRDQPGEDETLTWAPVPKEIQHA